MVRLGLYRRGAERRKVGEFRIMEEEKEIKVRKNRVSKYKSTLDSLERINGYLSPQMIVNEARAESSPLHDAFDWNDDTAAEKYRLMQARMLMTQVRVQISGRDYGAFTSVTIQVKNTPTRGYISTERVISDEELLQQVIDVATREIEYWQEKYNAYNELKGIINVSKLEEVKSIKK